MSIEQFAPGDTHGRRSLVGMDKYLPDKYERTLKARRTWAPKAKNGLTDPFTFYHILDTLLQLQPGVLFTAKELVEALGERPLVFDPVTVGRILGDISESLNEANQSQPIGQARAWDGRRYWVDSGLENRIALERLLEDIALLCEKGEPDQRSPLYRCPSVAGIVV